MADMLVKLYELPSPEPFYKQPKAGGFAIRKPIGPEKHVIVNWIRQHFNASWASEAEMAFMNRPLSLFIATKERRVYGFACYDATVRGFFGPMGVAESQRGQGLGSALLIACLHDMYAQGYGYAIIGGVGPAAFYEKTVGAMPIPDSTPGVYGGYVRDST